MEFSTLFQAFLIFYLLEVLFLVIFAWMLTREYQEEEKIQAVKNAEPNGPSASEIIKMRALKKEIERQQG